MYAGLDCIQIIQNMNITKLTKTENDLKTDSLQLFKRIYVCTKLNYSGYTSQIHFTIIGKLAVFDIF